MHFGLLNILPKGFHYVTKIHSLISRHYTKSLPFLLAVKVSWQWVFDKHLIMLSNLQNTNRFLASLCDNGLCCCKSSLHFLNYSINYFVVLSFQFSITSKCVSLTHPIRQIQMWELPFPLCQVPHEVSPHARFSSSPGKSFQSVGFHMSQVSWNAELMQTLILLETSK